MMIKQTLLETSARKFMPKLFAGISDDQVRRVKEYIKLYTQHPFEGTATGAVLDDAASSQGKMIRPRLVLMAGSFGTDRDDVRERLYKLAAVVEMTHLASLIHDDIVDDAPVRRGKPSVQSKYGKNAAVYAGDFLMSRITFYLMREGLNRAGMVIAQAVEEMCAGEIGQAMCRYKEDVTIDQYLQNIHGKTVALFRACCRIGAMESGCDERVSRMLESFGECLGYMFQMRDDLLDFVPDSSMIGKKAHQDFREGIYTLPVLLAREQPGKQDEFRAKPAWQRFLVMIAGVVMNVVLAVAIYIGICYTWGDTYFSNADAKWGYNFNEAGHKLGFHDGDRLVSIDGEEADDINKVVNSLIITESDRSVVVERNGRQVELILPLDELISMRQQKGYENFLLPRIPFLIDSVVNPTVAQLRKGDEIVAIDNVSGLDFAGYGQYLKAHAGDSVLLTVLREGDMLFEFKAPVSENGTLGVIRKGLALRTQKYTFLEAIPAGIQRTGKVISSYWDQLKMIVQPKTKMYEELGGFISIGSIFPSTWDWQDFWMKTAFLSIILAVMNILPIPGLDGGHAIFTFWEMISGRKVSDKVLEAAQYVGLIIILFLLLYANGNDIYRFFIK